MILCQNECATKVIITNTKMNTFLNQQCQKLTQKRVYYIINNKGPLSNLEGSQLSWNY